MSTTRNCNRTFKQGEIFRRLQENDWFVNLDRLETQQTAAQVGILLFAHNRWANHDDILGEIQEILAPLTCTDMDIRVDRPVRTYYAKNDTIEIENGSQKKLTIITKWPAIYAPVDIALELKERLVRAWPKLQTESKFAGLNCKRYVFIPHTPSPRFARNSNFTASEKRNFANYLHYMRKQNVFLNRCSQVVILQKVGNIYANFEWTDEMATQLGGGKEKVGLKQPLRTFLSSITRVNNPTEATIHSIHREAIKGTYSLLVNNDDAADLRATIDRLVPFLQATPAFSGIRVGGTNGTFTDGKFDANNIDYLAQLGTSDEFICEPTVLDAGGDSHMSTPSPPVTAIDFNTPPTNRSSGSKGRGRGRGSSKGSARWVRPTANAAAMNYRDVLTSNGIVNPYALPASSTTTSTSMVPSTQTSSLSSAPLARESEDYLTVDSLVNDAQFKQLLSNIIAPHLQPAMREVRTLQSTVNAIQARHDTLETSVASLANLGPKFDQMLELMGNLSQQSASSTQQRDPNQPPTKKLCGHGQQSHQGNLTQSDESTYSSPLHQHDNDEDEAGPPR